MCPTHSVWVPWACGLNQMLLKFTEAPFCTLPTQSAVSTGWMVGGSRYQAKGFRDEPRKGNDRSYGLFRSMEIVWFCISRVAFKAIGYFSLNVTRKDHLQSHHLKIFLWHLPLDDGPPTTDFHFANAVVPAPIRVPYKHY